MRAAVLLVVAGCGVPRAEYEELVFRVEKAEYLLAEAQKAADEREAAFEERIAALEAATRRSPPADPLTSKLLEQSIVKVDDTTYEVKRSLLLDSSTEVAKWLRVVPHRGPDGLPDGFRLSGIREGSPPTRAGLMNGDVLKSVNGHAVTSVDAAKTAYESIQDADRLELGIVRRRQPITLTLKLVE